MKSLIKFDVVHPQAWLQAKQAKHPEVRRMNLAEYREWLFDLGSNYSDFYTYWLNQTGLWDAEEYYFMDPLWTRKVAIELFGAAKTRALEMGFKVLGKVPHLHQRKRLWRGYVAAEYIRRRQPDVLFVRSQPQPSAYWQKFRKDCLLVARLSARLPRDWHPNDFDLIYTDQPDFQTFFRLHGVETILNDQGFDSRIAARMKDGRPSLGIVFIGGLGTQNFLARTEFFERIAAAAPFTWWGYWWDGPDGRTLVDFPGLERGFRGLSSGLEMYQAYHDADICLNDYVDTANGVGFNQRMFEVMGAGGFLLTRMAPNFAATFPPGIFATYADEADCLRKIEYYRARPDERRAIAQKGQEYILANYSYERIAREFSDDLLARLDQAR